MIRELVANLPTPLAVLLAGVLDELKAPFPKLLAACEIATQFMEYALRAQACYDEGLARRSTWGTRIQSIRSLLQTLRSNKLKPILELDDCVPTLDKVVQIRNKWAHPISMPLDIPHANELTDILHRVFMPLSQAELLVVGSSSGKTGLLLRGMRGLFSPRTVTMPSLTRPITTPELLLRRPPDSQVWLDPYLRYRTGPSGESIVEFWMPSREGRAFYHPISLSPIDAAAERGQVRP